jgi:hypothetical protein
VTGTAVHEVVDTVRELARRDCAAAWRLLCAWAASAALGAHDTRRATCVPAGAGIVTVVDGTPVVTGSWLGAPAEPGTEVLVVAADLDGEQVAVALPVGTVTTRAYTDAGLDSLPLTGITCVEVAVTPADVLGAPAPLLVGVAGIVAGLAQELTEQVTTLARTKIRSGTADVLLSDPIVLRSLLHARVELDALVARLFDEMSLTSEVTPMTWVVARVLIDRAEELSARILSPVGSAALYLSSPLQQLMRDLATVARHASTVPSDVAQAALAPRP